jgi:hypothetical protein
MKVRWYCQVVNGRASKDVEREYPLFMRQGDPASDFPLRFPICEAYFDRVLAQLHDRVTLCTYEHGETGSALRTLAFSDFSREEILAGIQRYLDARVPHLSN